MNKFIKIAVLDSGIEKKSLGYQTNITYLDNEIWDTIGHGTMCFNFLKERASSFCEFYIVKILDDFGRTNFNVLYKALVNILYTDIDIINLSLSIIYDIGSEGWNKLFNICRLLKKDGKIIVCALKNRELVSIPAMFSSVIGVRGGYFTNEMCYWYNKKFTIQALTSGVPILVRTINNQRKFFSGNSKATIIMTYIIAKIIYYEYNKNNIETYLMKKANEKEWKEEDIKFLYNKWCNSNSRKEKIDNILKKYISDLIYNNFDNDELDINNFLSSKRTIKIENFKYSNSYIKLLEIIEKKEKKALMINILNLQTFQIYQLYVMLYKIHGKKVIK